MITLYDQFNRPIDMSKNKKPERRELAVAPILDSYREYINDGLTPERLATVFKRADAGDVRSQAELFELLEERDGHVMCERDKRRNVIVDLDYTIEPADDDPRSATVAEFVQDWFDNCADWDDDLVALQDAVGKGYSAMELHWDNSEGQAIPARIERIEQKRFSFVDESGVLSRVPRLLTDTDSMGVEIPAWKTIMHRYGGKCGSPTRAGIYRVCAWMVLFKNYAIKDWVVFCELFGMPLRLGYYDQGATKDDKDALFAAISSLGSDAAGVISKATEIKFIESAKGSTATDLWEKLANFCNAENSKAILGQTLSAQVGDKGSYAASKTHNEVRLDLLQTDGRALASTVRSQLIRPMVGFNFGWDTPLPKYKAVYKEAEDLEAKANWLEKVMNTGMPVGGKYLREQFSIPEPEKDEEVIRVQTVLPGQQFAAAKIVASDKPQRAFSPEQQALEDLAAASAGTDPLAANEDAILKIVQTAGSYEEAMEELLKFYPRMDVGSLQAGLDNAMINGHLLGRKMVQDGQR